MTLVKSRTVQTCKTVRALVLLVRVYTCVREMQYILQENFVLD